MFNSTVDDNALFFISPSKVQFESSDVLNVITLPMLMIGAMLKLIEWLEQIV
jgi:hypothetical protein